MDANHRLKCFHDILIRLFCSHHTFQNVYHVTNHGQGPNVGAGSRLPQAPQSFLQRDSGLEAAQRIPHFGFVQMDCHISFFSGRDRYKRPRKDNTDLRLAVLVELNFGMEAVSLNALRTTVLLL